MEANLNSWRHTDTAGNIQPKLALTTTERRAREKPMRDRINVLTDYITKNRSQATASTEQDNTALASQPISQPVMTEPTQVANDQDEQERRKKRLAR